MATAVSGPSTVILRSVLKTKEEFFSKAVADRYQRSAMGQPVEALPVLCPVIDVPATGQAAPTAPWPCCTEIDAMRSPVSRFAWFTSLPYFVAF
jgi:hypothetical protein